MVEVREFITTYNLHFLTNYAAEEFILTEKKADYIDIKFNSSFEAKRMMTWLDKNISPVNNELYKMRNVIITPHIASISKEYSP